MMSWWHTISVHCLLFGLVSITNLRAQQPASTMTAADVQGPTLFDSNCGSCHGSDGRGGEHGPDIATDPDVQRLADSDLVELDPERKAAMVSNLMVVLSGDHTPTPVINTGTLYG